MLSGVFQYTKARLHSWTEDEAHNLTHNDDVWELVKAADRAVLATATPLKQVAELRGVAKTSVYPIVRSVRASNLSMACPPEAQ